MASHLKIIAGLGNPEERHARTLHNAGFWFVDELARRDGTEFRFEKRFAADICKIRISGDADGYVDCDGETIGRLPLELEMKQQALNFLVAPI